MPGTLRAWKHSDDDDDRKAVSEADRCLGAASGAVDDDGGVMVPACAVGVGVEFCRELAVAVAADDDDDAIDASPTSEAGCGDDDDAASNDVLGVLAAAGTWPSGSVGVRGGPSDWFEAADEVDSSDGGRLIGRPSSASSSAASIATSWLAVRGAPCCRRRPADGDALRLPSALDEAAESSLPEALLLETAFGLPSSPSSLRRTSLALAICWSKAASSRTRSCAGYVTRSRWVGAAAAAAAGRSDAGGGMSGVVLVCRRASDADAALPGRAVEVDGAGDDGRAVEVDDVEEAAVGLAGAGGAVCG